MVKRCWSIWADDSEMEKIKEKARKERQSTSQFLLKKALETPNLATGDWWDNPDAIRKIIKVVKNGKN